MGAEGGIKIISINKFKKNWLDIKQKVIRDYEDTISTLNNWSTRYDRPDLIEIAESELSDVLEIVEEIKSLPDSIYAQEDWSTVMSYLLQYDTPYIYKKDIIFAWGDNVSNLINTFTENIKGLQIQTWS